MTENTTEEQRVSRLSRWVTLCRGKTGVAIFVVALLCVVVLSVLFAFSKAPKSCNTKENDDCGESKFAVVGKICGGTFLIIFVGSGAVVIGRNKRHRKSRDVVVSEIPREDLEKSPAPILPYNHIPHRPAICQACSTDLPDYFIAISNVSEVSPQLSGGFWTIDIDTSDDENGPPPCYEEALRMSKYFSVAADLEYDQPNQQGQSEDTRL